MNRASQAAGDDNKSANRTSAGPQSAESQAQDLGVEPLGPGGRATCSTMSGGMTEIDPPDRGARNRAPLFRRRWGQILLIKEASLARPASPGTKLLSRAGVIRVGQVAGTSWSLQIAHVSRPSASLL